MAEIQALDIFLREVERVGNEGGSVADMMAGRMREIIKRTHDEALRGGKDPFRVLAEDFLLRCYNMEEAHQLQIEKMKEGFRGVLEALQSPPPPDAR